MPLPTPFHPVTSQLCESMNFKDWAGYFSVTTYGYCHEPEYFAIRHKAALIDVSPLFKYRITGKDAAAFLSYLTVKDVSKLKVGQVTYLCWCDDAGYLMDDGTVTRMSDQHFMLTAAEPSLFWLQQQQDGYDVSLEDCSDSYGTLSIQGPNSRVLLDHVTGGAAQDIKFFRGKDIQIDGSDAWLSRTGYTGDLGYELWVDSKDAPRIYEVLMQKGKDFGATPVGLDAMDIARIEAGFIMNGVDYFSCNHCMIDDRKTTPYEMGLGWTVKLDRGNFIGQKALKAEFKNGPKRKMVGLDIDWVELEALWAEHDLPPEVASGAWRDPKPVYNLDGEFIGPANSGTWSPTLKKNLALALVEADYAEPGTKVNFEVTVEYRRRTVTATVTNLPFFNPERKRT